ncbi:MAG: terminase large subunit [Rickettsiales bacterium]|jgi:phage terminase large subunit-like protein|nr:terminase large subunit [Rickettsiales bacterium]
MKSHFNEVKKYCNDIKKGIIPAGIYTKKSVNRFLDDIKRKDDESFLYSFIPEQADKIINFAETLFIPDINKKLELLSWHKFIYYNLFGFYSKADITKRRFRQAYVEVARKNSKTTSLLFPIILYDFMYTPAAESFFVSKDNNQSAKTYIELRNIFINTFKPDQSEIVVTDSRIRKESTNSFIQFFSSESRGTDSFKNSCSVIDEFWSYDDDKVVTAFRYGSRARKNTLVLIITSAGLDISGPCYLENEKVRKILNGVLTDDTYFGIIYAYDEKDDWKDKNNLIKANPSLHDIIKPEILENDLNDALISPSHQSDFKAKTCGIWSNAVSNWIPIEKWDTEKRNIIVDINEFNGQPCYAGLDLSSINDFTAYTRCFKKDGCFYLYHKFYIPSEQISEKYRVENINIKEWVYKGIVTVIDGPTINYDFIMKDIIDDYCIFRSHRSGSPVKQIHQSG